MADWQTQKRLSICRYKSIGQLVMIWEYFLNFMCCEWATPHPRIHCGALHIMVCAPMTVCMHPWLWMLHLWLRMHIPVIRIYASVYKDACTCVSGHVRLWLSMHAPVYKDSCTCHRGCIYMWLRIYTTVFKDTCTYV